MTDSTDIIYAEKYPVYCSKKPNNFVTRSVTNITSLRPIIKIALLIVIMCILILIFLIIYAYFLKI
jgi:hypothetical protein